MAPLRRPGHLTMAVGGLSGSSNAENGVDVVEYRSVRLLAETLVVAHEAAVGSPEQQVDLGDDVVQGPVRYLSSEFEADLEVDRDSSERDVVRTGLLRALVGPRAVVQPTQALELADRSGACQHVVAELRRLVDLAVDPHPDVDGAERVGLPGSALVLHETSLLLNLGIVLPSLSFLANVCIPNTQAERESYKFHLYVITWSLSLCRMYCLLVKVPVPRVRT